MDIIINEGVTKMKTLKARHKLIPAIVMLIVAAITMTTASYAWFTMSTRAEVTGIELTVIAPENLLIRTAEVGGLGKMGTWGNVANFGGYFSANDVNGVLTHASSKDGLNMFTVANTQDIVYTGDLVTGVPLTSISKFEDDQNEYAYIDFYLDIVNTGDPLKSIDVGITNLKATSDGSAEGDKLVEAVRVALIDYDLDTSRGVYSNTVDTFPVFVDTDQDNRANLKTGPTHDDADAAFAGETLFNLVGIGAAPNNDDNNTLVGGAGATRVLVRIWIEGEHVNAITENAGQDFNVTFDLVVVTP